jgi:membrane associated rhomboid family serine protease
MLRLPPAVKNLIIINSLMLFITWAINRTYGFDLDKLFGLYYFQSPNFHVYQFFTHMFMHGGLLHLFFNMYALFIFGSVLEQVWGSKRFLIYYLITGLGAAAFYTFVNYLEITPMINAAHAFVNTPSPDLLAHFVKDHISNPNRQVFDFIALWSEKPNDPQFINQAIAMVNNSIVELMNNPTVGASGAIFGVLLAFGMLFPNTELMLLFPPIPIKAKYFVMIYGALELYLGITQPGSQIAHFAHIGGMLFGFLLLKYWQYNRSRFY